MPALKAPPAPLRKNPNLRLDYARPCPHHNCPTLRVRRKKSVCLLDWLLMVVHGQTASDVLPASRGRPPALVFSRGLLLPLYRPSQKPTPPLRAFSVKGLLEKVDGRRLVGCLYSEREGEAVLYFSLRHDIATALESDDLIERLGLKQWQDEDDLIEVAVHPESVRQLGR